MARSAVAAVAKPLEVVSRVELVTPAQAKKWLEIDNHLNRKIRFERVNYLADEMMAGRWRLTHEGLAFDPQGNLLDGQHRLSAIVKTGMSILIMVTRNIDREAYVAMNRGAMRSIADVLRVDASAVGVATSIVRHIQARNYHAAVAPEDVRMALEAMKDEIHLVNSVKAIRPLAKSPMRCGVALRVAQAGITSGHADLIMRQWKALNLIDNPNIDQTSGTLMKRVLAAPASTRSSDEAFGRAMTLAWQAFDPKNRTRQQFHIDLAQQREMVLEVRAVLRPRVSSANPGGSRLERALASTEEAV